MPPVVKTIFRPQHDYGSAGLKLDVFCFGPQSAWKGGEVINTCRPYWSLFWCCSYWAAAAGAIPVGAGSASEAIDVPGGQPVDQKGDPKRSKGETLEGIVGSVRSTLRSGRRINRGVKLVGYTRVGNCGGLSRCPYILGGWAWASP